MVKPSGHVISNLTYIMFEYVSGGELFDLCETLGGLGEAGTHFFAVQLVEALSYMHA